MQDRRTSKAGFYSEHRLFIVSNRLPLELHKVDGQYKSKLSGGGLVTSLSGVNRSTNVSWYGWPGSMIEDAKERKVAEDALAENNAAAIWIDEELANRHYNDFSSGFLP